MRRSYWSGLRYEPEPLVQARTAETLPEYVVASMLRGRLDDRDSAAETSTYRRGLEGLRAYCCVTGIVAQLKERGTHRTASARPSRDCASQVLPIASNVAPTIKAPLGDGAALKATVFALVSGNHEYMSCS